MLAVGALSATVTTLGLAWLNVWLQFFGETADRGDYAVASGVTAGGLGFLALASVAAWLAAAPRWLHVWCWASTVVLLLVTLSCANGAGNRELDAASNHETFGSGVETAMMMPWNWLVVAALLAALAVRVPAQRGAGRSLTSGIVTSRGRSRTCTTVAAADSALPQSAGS